MARGFDVDAVRREIPALGQEVHSHPLSYLDNASTTLKPRPVIDAVHQMMARDCANIHRGVHTLSQRATARFEAARSRVARFLGGVDPGEVVFVRGTTEGLNLVAQAFGRGAVGAGDEVLVTELEHHSNLVPWQMLCRERGARLRYIPLLDDGSLDLAQLPALVGPRTRIVCVSHMSNSLGTIDDVRAVADAAHGVGAAVVVDGAQAAAHLSIDVAALGADFYAFSGHKVYGPTGAGVLWGRRALLEAMPPWQGGGEMIASVSLVEGTEYAELPHRLEAGTPDIAGVVGLAAALDWLDAMRPAFEAHEAQLLDAATEAIGALEGVRLVGTAKRKAAVLSFALEGIHPHDAGTILDTRGIAVRTGHHCTEPVMERYGLPATIRASFGVYNTMADVERLVDGVKQVREVLGRGR